MRVFIGKYPKRKGKERTIRVEIAGEDVWSLDHTLALVIGPALREFKKRNNGLWGDLLPCRDDGKNTKSEMRRAVKQQALILGKMIRAFELVADDCATFDKGANAEIEEGLALFAKYYRGLWI